MNDLRIVNLSSYTSPEIVEKSNKQWVAYGSDNNFFGHLISNYENSPTNNAIINAISQQIYGLGLDASDSNRRPEQYAKMITMFHKDCVQKLCFDLKLMGQCALQVIYSKDRKTIAQVEHIPVENLRAEKCNEKGKIEGYYYSDDWSKVKQRTELKRIPAFGCSKENIEIIYVKPYRAGYKYYSSPDYTGCLQWCEIESEVSNFHLNNVQGSFSPNTLIQFNNGTPNAEERQDLENRIASKFLGTGGNKFILAFNDNQDAAATVETLPISDAHNTYEYVSSQATEKIMVGHRVVSPMLYGIKDATGLGNNAEELKTASILMQNLVIAPFQHLLIDAFDSILAFNQISLKLYFKTLQPLQFIDLENVEDEETKEEETGVKLSEKLKEIDGKQAYETIEEAEAKALEQDCEGYHEHIEDGKTWYMPCKSHSKASLSDEETSEVLGSLAESGVVMSDDYVYVDEIDADDNLSNEDWAGYLIKETKSTLSKVKGLLGLKDEITSKKKGSSSSYLDSKNGLYKVRYTYAIGSRKPSKTQRPFCRNMMNMAKAGIVWTIEDIDRASREGVNREFGHNGQPFSLFKFKGGIYCRHKFKKVLYRLESNTEPSENLGNYKKTRTIPKSYIKNPVGSKQAGIAPENMPNRGAYPN